MTEQPKRDTILSEGTGYFQRPGPVGQLGQIHLPGTSGTGHDFFIPSLRTITLEELERRSNAYAEAMMSELEEFNRQYPVANGLDAASDSTLDPKEQQRLKETFREDFFLYMANQYVIVPAPVFGPSVAAGRK